MRLAGTSVVWGKGMCSSPIHHTEYFEQRREDAFDGIWRAYDGLQTLSWSHHKLPLFRPRSALLVGMHSLAKMSELGSGEASF